MRTSSHVFITFFLFISFTGSIQDAAHGAQRSTEAAASPGHRITLDVVVTDRSGKPVRGLQQQHFTILDNKQPQTVTFFRQFTDTDLPVQAIVVVDTLNAPYQNVGYQRVQLEKFLRHDGGELPVPTSLFFLPDTSQGRTVTTRNGNTLGDALNSATFGASNFYRLHGFFGDAERTQNSLSTFQRFISHEATQPGRKLLIWLGPGWPLLSGPETELTPKNLDAVFRLIVDLSTTLREAHITVYNVDRVHSSDEMGAFAYQGFLKGAGSIKDVQNGDLGLQVMAIQSGGRVLNTTNDIAGAIADCLTDAKAFYALSFDAPPAAHTNEYHNLQVKVDVQKVTVRTRAGYYAQP